MTPSRANSPRAAYASSWGNLGISARKALVDEKTVALLMDEEAIPEASLEPFCMYAPWIGLADLLGIVHSASLERSLIREYIASNMPSSAPAAVVPGALSNLSKTSHPHTLAEFRQHYEQELSGLRKQVEKLTSQVAELLAAVHGRNEDETVPQSPHDLWIEQNMNELRRYPNHWIALDAEKGIVIAEQDREQFSERYSKLSADAQDRLLLFHSSMYV